MNGAESLVRTLVGGGVDTCFANPGTSEMHFVSALDRVAGIRCILCLFEGVATGAADGYSRMADKPAATLLHLGPGLGNGLANLHNARRARSSIVNIVGDHATYHLHLDAPLTSDIESIARPMSAWVRTTKEARMVGADAADAISAARSAKGQIATLILPADTAWTQGGVVAAVPTPEPPKPVSQEVVDEIARALRNGNAMILIGGKGLRATPLDLAASIAAKCGIEIAAISRSTRIERGAGRVAIERIPNPLERSIGRFNALKTLVLIDESAPVAFFAHPGRPGKLTSPDCDILTLCAPGDDIVGALEALAAAVGAKAGGVPSQKYSRPDMPSGAMSIDKLGLALGALLPENAIVADELITTARGFFPATIGAPPHDWLQLTGGAIGLGIPMATGAAIACPDRKVINLQADGSGMYTFQSLWTQAREKLDVVTIIWANRSYKILHNEFASVGAGEAGEKARSLLELDNPTIDWVGLGKSLGVDGRKATTIDEFVSGLKYALAQKGPFLIEVVL